MFSRFALLLAFIGNLSFSQLSLSNDYCLIVNDEFIFVEERFNGFNVFQNTKFSNLNIYNPNALKKTTFSLFDISGRRVLKKRINSNKKNT